MQSFDIYIQTLIDLLALQLLQLIHYVLECVKWYNCPIWGSQNFVDQ